MIGTDSIDICKSNYQYDEGHRGPTLHDICWDHGKQCQISQVWECTRFFNKGHQIFWNQHLCRVSQDVVILWCRIARIPLYFHPFCHNYLFNTCIYSMLFAEHTEMSKFTLNSFDIYLFVKEVISKMVQDHGIGRVYSIGFR